MDDRFILITPSPLMTGTAQNALACMNDLYHVLFSDPVLTFGVRLIVFLVDVKSGYFTEKTSHVRILPCSSGVPRNSGESTFLGTVWIGDSLRRLRSSSDLLRWFVIAITSIAILARTLLFVSAEIARRN